MKKQIFYQSVLFVIFFLGISISLFALDFPDTPAGKRGSEIFELFNNKSKLTPKEYVSQNCTESFKSGIPESSWGGAIVQIRTITGEVELESIEKNEKNEILFTIKSKLNGMRFSINVSVEETSPNKIAMMRFMPAGQQGSNTREQNKQEVAVTQETIKKVDDFLKSKAEEGLFSGTALIAQDGKPIFVKSEGFANKSYHIPNKPDTKFNLGSINKSFTSVAILQLVEAGKIGIDDPIGKYLDNFPKDIAEKVTIRQLLNMSNGWGDYWQNEYYLAHKDQLRSVSDYIEFIKDIPLQFEPGTNTIHSNIGFEVAGAIIEKVSGMDYFNYIREHIYKPAGMLNSDYYDRDAIVENIAVGYTNYHPADKKRTGFEWANTYILSPKGTPAGGGYSTVEDMLKYDMAVRNNKILGEEYVNFLSSGYRGNIGDPINKKLAKAAGGAYGVSTFFARDWNSGYTIVVLTNVDHPVGSDIGNEIVKIISLE